ncbi:hypothetical protein AC579_9367 [Pseudocercospora musae]|uniref:Acyl carrier protein n=1 Tax=Pseudocercospora musae TaxID=113226 RepID=A0A139I5T6_9PEZI|nr:hypothetical protein AC579_9367 [Pseudocercospora musae]KXT09986.1 hypothetical protein AC579_9367 [Pseudocercospora musae]
MFRTALLRSARCVALSSTRAAQPAVRTYIRSPFVTSRISTPATRIAAVRCYASASGLGQEEVTGRILDLLKNFDKLSATSHFTNDLGLDSLDTVEVVMAIEEVRGVIARTTSKGSPENQEFSIEIPDKEADAIQSVSQAVDYIMKQPDAH